MTGTSASTTPVAFWLLPAPPDHARLSAIVEALCREFDAPWFEPHLTLYVGEHIQSDIEALVHRIATSSSPMTLVACGTAHGPALFKTLFIEFAPDPGPPALQAALLRQLELRSDYALDPHVSLLYKTLSAVQRASLARRFDFYGQPFAFDRLVAVRPGGETNTWDEIAEWQVCISRQLGTPEQK